MTEAQRITRKLKRLVEQAQLNRAIEQRPEIRILMSRHEALAQSVEILAAMQRSNEMLLEEVLRRLGDLEDDE